jgi:hypothetical protein
VGNPNVFVYQPAATVDTFTKAFSSTWRHLFVIVGYDQPLLNFRAIDEEEEGS